MSEHLETAFGIGAEICRDAIWWEHRCNWIGDVPDQSFGQKDKLRAQSLGPSLYNGTIGIAIFLAHLGVRTGEVLFQEHAIAAARQAFQSNEDNEPHSLHSGRFGVAFGLIELGTVLGHDEMATLGRKLLKGISTDETEAHGLDVISGAAGTLLGLAELFQRHALEPPLDYLQRLARQLIQSAQTNDHGVSWRNIPGLKGPNLNGYAHGVSGNGSPRCTRRTVG